ncbi:hypothetical protein [Streptomyces sp. NBC_01803]|uniref:hypothetical protein n=1 Tax=Streptomyces sp. NBC_01803 TaxID=2975946 RepID=UPI002DDB6FA3|nr:hypothetical protein [Streptomyces sp. NBC_01803]WSA43405.1 hypothetical protein OIE51_03860 [Streptomyces sp. NBC_01803]
MRATHQRRDDAAEGIAQLEGYLLWQAELSNARAEAAAFADALPWLTDAQRAELTTRYAEDRIRLARRVLAGVADRCRVLESEYTTRYRELRHRLLCAAGCVLLAAVSLSAGLLLVAARS